jgi:hypothetical protein
MSNFAALTFSNKKFLEVSEPFFKKVLTRRRHSD